MADRIASVWRFRAEGVRLSWPVVARRMLAQRQQWHLPVDPDELERIAARGDEIALRWATSSLLGVPPHPFTVWVRKAGSSEPDRPVEQAPHPLGRLLRWSGEGVTLEVRATVTDGTRPVVLAGFRGAVAPTTVVSSTRATGATGTTVDLLLNSTDMTSALLVGGSLVAARVDSLGDVVRADDWKEWEVVGLPVGDGPDGLDLRLDGYDDREQGLVSALTVPVEAALQRLDRAGPPVGWWPATETGHVAPDWRPPKPEPLLQVARLLLPEAADLFTVPPPRQVDLSSSPPFPPPEQDGRAMTQASSASVGPLGALMVPATTDPFYALALGFGTGYSLSGDQEALYGMDFLVTADFPETPEGGPASYAAYIPAPLPHTATAPVTSLAAGRDGLVRPAASDLPWRETIRISWDAMGSTAALGRQTGFSLLRFDPVAGSGTECLLERRTPDDWLPRVPSRGPSGLASGSIVTSDSAQEIPLGSGGHSVGYCVAVQDVFGIWSTWEDVAAATPEPGPPLPRILSAELVAAYDTPSSCPAVLSLELALDWSDRTVASLEVAVSLFPAATSAWPPPPGTTPGAPAAAVVFAGDVPTGVAGVTVTALDASGTQEVPPGAAQGQEGRRYRMTFPLGSLDYSATRFWGAAVWARTSLTVLGTGPWAPGAPALAYAASPVPPALPLPPPLPGVPVGSTPDARGCSHVQVVWGDPGTPVEHFAVYEVAETALRSVLPPGALPTLPPSAPVGTRLAQLKTAYDTLLSPTQRRVVFRRLSQPPATARSADVVLPQGSTDIHLFAVIAVGRSSVESPWPQTFGALQAFRAPTVLAPAPPVLRPTFVDVGGATQLSIALETDSAVPVTSFRLFRTTLADASRSAETMGPAFAEVPAVGSGDPVSATGTRRYLATWQGAPVPGWRPSLYRAVAAPVPSVPVDGVVGVPSPGSPVVPVNVPPAGPADLDPFAAADWDETGVVVRTATAAPLWRPELGPHRLAVTATVAGAPVFAAASTTLDAIAEDEATPPAGGDPGPQWVRGPRAAGRTPLALWFRRASADDEVTVTVRLTDPLGRVTTRTLTVPPAVAVPPTLEMILTTAVIAGRGIAIRFRSDASVVAEPEGVAVLAITARRSLVGPFPPPPPLTLEVPVPDIPESSTLPLPPATPIVVVRQPGPSPHEYAALVRLLPPAGVRLTMTGPTGMATTVPLDF